jgi:hypothetical protein
MDGVAFCTEGRQSHTGYYVHYTFHAYLPNRYRVYKANSSTHNYYWQDVPWYNNFEGNAKIMTNQRKDPAANIWYVDVGPFPRDPLVEALTIPEVKRSDAIAEADKSRGAGGRSQRHYS